MKGVTITVRGVARDLRVRFRVSLHRGLAHLAILSGELAGNLDITMLWNALPIEHDLDLNGDNEVARLNDVPELWLEVDGESWTFNDLTIHELRLDVDLLTAELSGSASRDDGADEASIAISIHDHVQLEGEIARSKTPSAVDAPMRDDTFDVSLGLGKLRWRDDEETIRKLYPDVLDVPSVTSPVDPMTGETDGARARPSHPRVPRTVAGTPHRRSGEICGGRTRRVRRHPRVQT